MLEASAWESSIDSRHTNTYSGTARSTIDGEHMLDRKNRDVHLRSPSRIGPLPSSFMRTNECCRSKHEQNRRFPTTVPTLANVVARARWLESAQHISQDAKECHVSRKGDDDTSEKFHPSSDEPCFSDQQSRLESDEAHIFLETQARCCGSRLHFSSCG